MVFSLVQQTFGNVIHNIVLKYDSLDKSKLRRFENLSIKLKKADLDLTLLPNCWTLTLFGSFWHTQTMKTQDCLGSAYCEVQ